MSGTSMTAIGLMSGTSMDGVDAALLVSDGEAMVEAGPSLAVDYAPDVRLALKAALAAAPMAIGREPMPPEIAEAERQMTLAHGDAIKRLLAEAGVEAGAVDVVGFHGQTLYHDPDHARTWQIGNARLLAQLCGIDVVSDFRSADVAAGGQGAPFASLFHGALVASARAAHRLAQAPVAVLNLGGVANVTWVGRDGALLAFDTGPANGPLDDWIESHTGAPMDAEGAIAARGRVHDSLVLAMLDHPYFDARPPKSLDRQDFVADPVRGLSLEDGAATLLAFTAASIAAAAAHFPEPVAAWVACGGGRKNPVLMRALEARLGASLAPAEALGWRGDVLEAEAFAYLAIRMLKDLPLSLPETTGVPAPMRGGRLTRA